MGVSDSPWGVDRVVHWWRRDVARDHSARWTTNRTRRRLVKIVCHLDTGRTLVGHQCRSSASLQQKAQRWKVIKIFIFLFVDELTLTPGFHVGEKARIRLLIAVKIRVRNCWEYGIVNTRATCNEWRLTGKLKINTVYIQYMQHNKYLK